VSCVTKIELAAIVGEICKYNTQIDKAREDTGTETTNRCGGLLILLVDKEYNLDDEKLTISARYTGATTTVWPTPSPAIKRPA
jgi:hypothetical protein